MPASFLGYTHLHLLFLGMNNIPGSLTDNHFLLPRQKPQYLSDNSCLNHVTDYRGIQDGGANSETVERKKPPVKIRVAVKKLCLLKDPGKGLLKKWLYLLSSRLQNLVPFICWSPYLSLKRNQ